MNKLDLANRNAVVTGGSSGIGMAIVNRLLSSGANVSIWDLNTESLNEFNTTKGQFVCYEKTDVTSIDDIKISFNKTIEKFDKIDILINSAGIAGVNATVSEYPEDEWIRVHNVNLNGTFYVCKKISKHMMSNKYGRIVNIASIAGKEGNPNACAYSSSKAAVIAFTKSLGKELATNNICVNCVTPAAVKTPIFDEMSQSHINYMLSKIPMNRFGLVEEIAATVTWMCTEDCSFTTGGVIDLSGGRATY